MAVSQCCCCRVAQCHTLNARSLFSLLNILLCNLLFNSDKRSSSLPSLVKLPTVFLLYTSALRVSIFTSFGFLSHLQLLPSPQHPRCSSPPFHTFVQHSFFFRSTLISSFFALFCYPLFVIFPVTVTAPHLLTSHLLLLSNAQPFFVA